MQMKTREMKSGEAVFSAAIKGLWLNAVPFFALGRQVVRCTTFARCIYKMNKNIDNLSAYGYNEYVTCESSGKNAQNDLRIRQRLSKMFQYDVCQKGKIF